MSETVGAVNWTLNDHLRNGEIVISNLLSIPRVEETDPRVCFHFSPVDDADDDLWGEEASYIALAKPLLDVMPFWSSVDYVGGFSGIEAWEKVIPSIPWLHERIPSMLNVAAQSRLSFDGWSFEPHSPRGFSFLNCGPDLGVVNAATPEGRAAIDELVRESGPTKAKNS